MDILRRTVGVLFPAIRISLALVLLTILLLFAAEMLGFMPDQAKFQLDSRKRVSEALAIQFSVLAPDKDARKIQKILSYVVKRNPEMISAGVRLSQGQMLAETGDHLKQWRDYDEKKSSATHLVVPILQNNKNWGNIEIKFTPLRQKAWYSFIKEPIFKVIGFITVIGFFVYLLFMFRTLLVLDPSAVIPERVNAAFNTLTEGILIVDEHGQIVLVNKAFTDKIGRVASTLLGHKASKLNWLGSDGLQEQDLPWYKVLRSGKTIQGSQLSLKAPQGSVFKFNVNASPIQGNKLDTQGVLVTFDDITELEERNASLQTMVSRLEESQRKIQYQNKELHFLATRDPLTGCLNRRFFTEQFEKAYKDAIKGGTELSCIMVDIDHFKKVNDTFGHATGDVIIKLLAEVLLTNTRKVDLVSRFGGEEFCIVMPGAGIEEAFTLAERIRLRLKDESAARTNNEVKVTVSAGVASITGNSGNPSELTHQADMALYEAKNTGRNRVIRWQGGGTLATSEVSIAGAEQALVASEPEAERKSESVSQLQLRINELETIASQFSAELEHIKNYDVLTGLPNQVLFFDRIGQVIERGLRHYLLAAVLIIDIVSLGQINNSLGRAVGDKILLEIAERLNAIFRNYDGITRLTLSRLGGDEFAVLLTELPSKEAVTWIVKRLLDSLEIPIEVEGNSIFLTGHIGISMYPSDGATVDDLINKATLAKDHGKKSYSTTNFQFFDSTMQEMSDKFLSLDKELRRAVNNEEWELLYQPKMNIKTKRITGVEALIRWRHPSRGLLSPFEFIEFAEQRGLIVAIGEWVIKTVSQQLQEWAKQGLSDYTIAINLSAVQIRQEDFASKTLQALTDSGIPARRLEFEVTESTLMFNLQTALAVLKRLNSNGVSIAIDDFGTGYSSLSYLKNLPIDTLKIDRSFIKDICNNDNDKQIVKALISMAHSLKMAVVAEGVEESNQLALLESFKCDEIQGYLLSKPISSVAITDMLIKQGSVDKLSLGIHQEAQARLNLNPS